MDDETIEELYGIPEEEKTINLTNFTIQKKDNRMCYISCPDKITANQLSDKLGSIARSYYNSTKVTLDFASQHLAYATLKEEGISVEYNWEDDGPHYPEKYPDDWNIIRKAVYYRDDYTCQDCGTEEEELHADHIVPISKGGEHELDNLITKCGSCHSGKHGFEV